MIMADIVRQKNHGSYDIEIFERLIRVRAHGGWNEAAAWRFNDEYKAAVSSLSSGPWAVYFDLRGWGLAIPDAVPYLEDLANWTAPQGPGTHVFLFNGMEIQEVLISRILSLASHDSFFFSNQDECRTWIDRKPFYSGDPDT